MVTPEPPRDRCADCRPSRRSQTEAGRRDDRGQAFTLEAVVASLLLLGTVVVVLQSTAVTPGSSSTTGQYVHDRQRALVAGALDAAAADGSVEGAVLSWNPNASRFHGAGPDGTFVMGGPPNAFGALLNRTFEGRTTAYVVTVRYAAANGTTARTKLVDMGHPDDTGVRVSETVTLYDDDRLLAADGSATNTTLGESTSFFAPDVYPESPLYNVVRVEVVVWRT